MPQAARELRALGERLDSPHALVEACHALVTNVIEGDVDELIGQLLVQRQRAATAGDLPLDFRALFALAVSGQWTGDHRAACSHMTEALRGALRMGDPALEISALNGLAWTGLMSGEWDEARRYCAHAAERTRRAGQPRLLGVTQATELSLLVLSGELEAADQRVLAMQATIGAAGFGDHRTGGMFAYGAARLALERGDRAGALRALAAAGRTLSPFPPLTLALLGEAQAAGGQAEAALGTAARLRAVLPARPSNAGAHGARVMGLALRSLGRRDEALAALNQAAAAWEALNISFDAARARFEWAELVRTSDRRAATDAALASLRTFEQLGARLYAERARTLLRGLGERPRATRPTVGAALSPRELEVARLVADGLTTPQIAAQLVLSPRTVSAHLDRIYGRLGLNSRSALVRYLAEHDLIGPRSGAD